MLPNPRSSHTNHSDLPTSHNYKPLPLLNKLRNTQYRIRPTDTQDLTTIQYWNSIHRTETKEMMDCLQSPLQERQYLAPQSWPNAHHWVQRKRKLSHSGSIMLSSPPYSIVTRSAGCNHACLKRYGRHAILPYNKLAGEVAGQIIELIFTIIVYTYQSHHIYCIHLFYLYSVFSLYVHC